MRLTFFPLGFARLGDLRDCGFDFGVFAYRHNLPLTLRSALYPLIGNRIHGKWGDAVDIFAVVGTLFGVATSLGYGVLQINTGLNYLFPNLIAVNTPTQIVLIAIVTALATLSVVSGLDKGVKMLSELNLGLAAILLLFILLMGSTVFCCKPLCKTWGIMRPIL